MVKIDSLGAARAEGGRYTLNARTLAAVALAVCLAQMALSVPSLITGLIQQDLAPSSAQLTWIVDAFFLPVAALELGFGVFGDLFGRRRLLVGGADGAVAPVDLESDTLTRPSWTPTGSEAWTVLDSNTVARVVLDAEGNPRVAPVDAMELTSIGPVQDLRLSRDGLRVAAVVRGGLYAAALARSPDGDVAIRNVRSLRPADLGEVVAADWRAAETVVAVSRGSDGPVSQVSVDGLTWELLPSSNLTPPVRAVAAAPNRPVLVTDQSGVWSFAGGDLETWRQVVGGVPDAVPLYPG